MRLFITFIFLSVLAVTALPQNTVKLFDPVAISASDPNVIINATPYGMYRTAQVYVSCPTSGKINAIISGPNGGNLIVDNALLLNGVGICNGNCFSLIGTPSNNLGLPVESAYAGIAPVNVSRAIRDTGLYTFDLLDFGYTYGNSAIYLTTSCSIFPVNTPPPGPEPTPSPSPSPSPLPSPSPSPDTPPMPTWGDTTLCHRNNGSGGWTTLTVGESAVAAHLSHGDVIGPCGQ